MNHKHAELRRLAEAATPGPWGHDSAYVCTVSKEGETTYVQSWHPVADCLLGKDMVYVASANPSTILAILDELEACKRDAERMDWIEENYTGDGGGNHFNMRLRFERDIEDFGDSARGIIDAAMQERTK